MIAIIGMDCRVARQVRRFFNSKNNTENQLNLQNNYNFLIHNYCFITAFRREVMEYNPALLIGKDYGK